MLLPTCTNLRPVRSNQHADCAADAASNLPQEEELDPAATELATFKISGECPKCGRVFTRAHARHLAACTGATAEEQPTLAELIKVEVTRLETMDKKLSELEVGGLVDLDADKAVFMVVGSTGAF